MKIRRGRARARLVFSCLVSLACVAGILYSGYKIWEWKLDNDNTARQSEIATSAATVSEMDESAEEERPKIDAKKDSLYWKFLSTKLLDVDIDKLREINPETAGWINVSGTNINYPFVQTSNNDYYLKHSFDRSVNNAGWVFADFRNKLDGNDKNQIIYAHGRYDASMFGTLRNILSSGWLKNSDNFTVRTVSEHESALWQVFSAYKIPVTSDYIQTDFVSDEEYSNFLQKIQGRSVYNFGATLSSSDRILTLSTCYSKTKRVVLHARLIKRQTK